MIRFACGITMAVVLFAGAPAGWSQQYLYTPSSVGAEAGVSAKDGVLVQEVAVQKGDTLYGISRKFSGHGSYYPQILLFNDIKDPNKIYPGNVFRVPVSRNAVSGQADKPVVKSEKTAESGGAISASGNVDVTAVLKPVPASSAAPVTPPPASQDLKKADSGKEKKRTTREKGAATAKKQRAAEKQHTDDVATDSSAGQKLFERAVKAYRQEECRTALELFDRFLAENQTSPLAADASLYKAECYLKLSRQN